MSEPFWSRAGSWFNKRSLKERVLVFSVGAAAICGSLYVLKFLPILEKKNALQREIESKESEVTALEAQVLQLTKGAIDPDKEMKARRDELKRLIVEAESGLQKKRDRTVAPDRVAQLLEDVLTRQGKLELVELKSLPPEPLFNDESGEEKKGGNTPGKVTPPPAAGADKPRSETVQGIYRHGVQIAVRGEYMDLLAYLGALERLPVQVFWKDIDVQLASYPEAVMKFTLFTVSFNRIWLSV